MLPWLVLIFAWAVAATVFGAQLENEPIAMVGAAIAVLCVIVFLVLVSDNWLVCWQAWPHLYAEPMDCWLW